MGNEDQIIATLMSIKEDTGALKASINSLTAQTEDQYKKIADITLQCSERATEITLIRSDVSGLKATAAKWGGVVGALTTAAATVAVTIVKRAMGNQ